MGSNIPAGNIKLKRGYEPPAAADGQRLLIDRLWLRGASKAEARIDQWIKDVAPSAALRKWFNHDPARWQEFRSRYAAELRAQPHALRGLRQLAREGPVTLVYGARDEEHNDAVVLREVMLGRWPKSRRH